MTVKMTPSDFRLLTESQKYAVYAESFVSSIVPSETEEAYRDALHRIAQWAAAYPLAIFPEPDFKKADELLKAGGVSLSAISASNMRHVVEGVGEIARAALSARQPTKE